MLLTQEFEAVPVGDLQPHPDNPRLGQTELIADSIRAHGFFGACVVQRRTGHILVGNHRWMAAQESGESEVPVLWVDVDDEQAKRILIADNRTSELAGWDDKKLADVLGELAVTATGLEGLAFNEDDLAALLELDVEDSDDGRSPDVLNALDVTLADPTHQVHHGEVYLLGPHVLVVARVATEWPMWQPYLKGDAVFCAHPSPFLPLSTLAQERPLVMVTSSTYLAGHVLDKWTFAGHGEPRRELKAA